MKPKSTKDYTVWKTLDLENLKLLQKLNYWEMGVEIYISCSYGTYMYGVLKPFSDTCCGLGDIQVSVEGVLDQVSRFFSDNFLTKICIKLEPTMLQHSFWAL